MAEVTPEKVKAQRKEANSFYQGFAVAVGTLARNGHSSIAKDIMSCNGVTLKQLQDAGAAEFDLEYLEP